MKYGKGDDVSQAMRKADRLIEDITKKKADNENGQNTEDDLPETQTGKWHLVFWQKEILTFSLGQ